MALMMASLVELTAQEALSGIFGSVSLAAWIFLLMPQLYENYRQQSAEGVSLPFLLIWALGDFANLAGAAWAQLVPTVIALAFYFSVSDVVLISQCLYYNLIVNGRWRKSHPNSNDTTIDRRTSNDTAHTDESNEEEPLLSRRQSHHSTSSTGLPGSHHRRKSSPGSLGRITEDFPHGSSILRATIKNVVCILLVCAVGACGWAIAWKTHAWKPAPLPNAPAREVDKKDSTPIGAQILGYLSAILYLGARIPQIYKNWKAQSCEGLSLLFFLLALLGNLTYGAGILFHSLEPHYLMVNLPWLIGSLGTMFEDCTIALQFRIYGDQDPKAQEESAG